MSLQKLKSRIERERERESKRLDAEEQKAIALRRLEFEQETLRQRRYRVLLGKEKTAPVDYVSIGDFEYYTRESFSHGGNEGGGGGTGPFTTIRFKKAGIDGEVEINDEIHSLFSARQVGLPGDKPLSECSDAEVGF